MKASRTAKRSDHLVNRLIRVLAAIALAGSVSSLSATSVSAGPTEAGNSLSLFDLQHPAAGINDPAAGLVPLSRDCSAGQVDINTADVSALGEAIGTLSKPTLERVIEGRPWFRAIDAVSVPGLGPSRAQRLKTALCAAPATLPPAQMHAPKAGFTGIDLQVASAQEIADAKLLPLAVAQRLKAYGPLPDNLHQVAAPAIPGLSDPTIERLLHDPNVAITPYPFTYQRSTWRWVSRDHGAIVSALDDPRYALLVPPRRVTGDGAWATTTPKDADQEVLPTGAFHIYGQWTPEIGVQLPSLSNTESADVAVMHDASDGPHISNGDGVAEGTVAGSVVVAASTLSDFITTLAQSNCVAKGSSLTPASQVWCIENLRDTPLLEAFKSTLAYQAHFAGRSPGPCPVADQPLMIVSGTMHSMTCEVAINGRVASVTWTNNSGDDLHFGNVYKYQKTPDSLPLSITRVDKGRFTTNTFDELADDFNVIPPGDKFTVRISQGDPPSTTGVASDESAIVFWSVSQFTLLLDAVADRAISPGQLIGCAISLANGDRNLGTFLSCGSRAIQNAVDLIRSSSSLSQEDKVLLASVSKKAGALGAIATGIDLGLSRVQWGAEDAWDTVHYSYRQAPQPVTASGNAASPMSDGKFIARVGTAAYLVGRPSVGLPAVAQPIKTGSDFNCYATGYFVIDNVSTFRSSDNALHLDLPDVPLVDSAEAGAPTCQGVMAQTWTYTPTAEGGNVPSGILVKMPDWEGRGSWWITPDGAIETVLDGGVYQCLAARAPVIFNFPFSKIQAWRPPGNEPARC